MSARSDDRDVVGADVRGDVEARPLARHGVNDAFDAHERAQRDSRRVRPPRIEVVLGGRKTLSALRQNSLRIVRGVAARVHEAQNEHLAAATFSFAHGLGDRGDPDLVPLADEHRVQPRRR